MTSVGNSRTVVNYVPATPEFFEGYDLGATLNELDTVGCYGVTKFREAHFVFIDDEHYRSDIQSIQQTFIGKTSKDLDEVWFHSEGQQAGEKFDPKQNRATFLLPTVIKCKAHYVGWDQRDIVGVALQANIMAFATMGLDPKKINTTNEMLKQRMVEFVKDCGFGHDIITTDLSVILKDAVCTYYRNLGIEQSVQKLKKPIKKSVTKQGYPKIRAVFICGKGHLVFELFKRLNVPCVHIRLNKIRDLYDINTERVVNLLRDYYKYRHEPDAKIKAESFYPEGFDPNILKCVKIVPGVPKTLLQTRVRVVWTLGTHEGSLRTSQEVIAAYAFGMKKVVILVDHMKKSEKVDATAVTAEDLTLLPQLMKDKCAYTVEEWTSSGFAEARSIIINSVDPVKAVQDIDKPFANYIREIDNLTAILTNKCSGEVVHLYPNLVSNIDKLTKENARMELSCNYKPQLLAKIKEIYASLSNDAALFVLVHPDSIPSSFFRHTPLDCMQIQDAGLTPPDNALYKAYHDIVNYAYATLKKEPVEKKEPFDKGDGKSKT